MDAPSNSFLMKGLLVDCSFKKSNNEYFEDSILGMHLSRRRRQISYTNDEVIISGKKVLKNSERLGRESSKRCFWCGSVVFNKQGENDL